MRVWHTHKASIDTAHIDIRIVRCGTKTITYQHYPIGVPFRGYHKGTASARHIVFRDFLKVPHLVIVLLREGRRVAVVSQIVSTRFSCAGIMVRVHIPQGSSEPITVRNDGKKRVQVQEDSPTKLSQTIEAHRSEARKLAEYEARYPRISMAVEALSMFAATTLGSLVLLPLSLRKTMLQLPRMAGHVFARSASSSFQANFVGTKATLLEAVVKMGSSFVIPPPASFVATYLAVVPLRGAISRAQSGVAAFRTALPKVASRGGLFSVWSAHLVRDLPQTLLEAVIISHLVYRKPENVEQRKSARHTIDEGYMENGNGKTGIRVGPIRQGTKAARGPHAVDSAIAACISAVLTTPLDLLRTRLLVSGRPSAVRTSRAIAAMVKRKGLSPFFSSPRSYLYIAECVARPLSHLVIYTTIRALLMTIWLQRVKKEEDKYRIVIE